MKAKPRKERTYPQAVRIYSTEEGTHPFKTDIQRFIPYAAVKMLLEIQEKILKEYNSKNDYLVDFNVDYSFFAPIINPTSFALPCRFTEILPYKTYSTG